MKQERWTERCWDDRREPRTVEHRALMQLLSFPEMYESLLASSVPLIGVRDGQGNSSAVGPLLQVQQL